MSYDPIAELRRLNRRFMQLAKQGRAADARKVLDQMMTINLQEVEHGRQTKGVLQPSVRRRWSRDLL